MAKKASKPVASKASKGGPKGKQTPGKTGSAGAGFGAGNSDASTWNDARNAKDTFGEVPDIEDGVYVASLSKAKCGNKDGVDWVSFGLVVESGQHEGYEGVNLDVFHHIKEVEKRDGGVITAQQKQEFLARDIGKFGYDPKTLKWSDIPDLCKEMEKDKPTVRVKVKNFVKATGEKGVDVRILGGVEEE